METVDASGQSADQSVSLPQSEPIVSEPSTQSPKQLTNTPPDSAPMPQPRPAKQQAASSRASFETAQPDTETAQPVCADEIAPTSTDVAIDGRKKKRSESNDTACVVRCCMSKK